MVKILNDDADDSRQGNLSKKLRGKKPISIEEISEITSIILERIASLPQKKINETKLYTQSIKVKTIDADKSVAAACEIMDKEGFTQLPVMNKETHKWGLITDFTILKRMLSPIKKAKKRNVSKGDWLKVLGNLAVKDAEVIDEAPTYSPKTSVSEIAQALLYHYAILILESRDKVGIVTRADLLQLLYE
jgi:predicted transcriptional regulator